MNLDRDWRISRWGKASRECWSPCLSYYQCDRQHAIVRNGYVGDMRSRGVAERRKSLQLARSPAPNKTAQQSDCLFCIIKPFRKLPGKSRPGELLAAELNEKPNRWRSSNCFARGRNCYCSGSSTWTRRTANCGRQFLCPPPPKAMAPSRLEKPTTEAGSTPKRFPRFPKKKMIRASRSRTRKLRDQQNKQLPDL